MQGSTGPQAAAGTYTARREQKGSRGAAVSLTEGLTHLVDRQVRLMHPLGVPTQLHGILAMRLQCKDVQLLGCHLTGMSPDYASKRHAMLECC